MAARYFGAHKEEKILVLPLSVEASEQINEVTLPKTMKMLFCSVCLTYDCRQHSLDEVIKEVNFI